MCSYAYITSEDEESIAKFGFGWESDERGCGRCHNCPVPRKHPLGLDQRRSQAACGQKCVRCSTCYHAIPNPLQARASPSDAASINQNHC